MRKGGQDGSQNLDHPGFAACRSTYPSFCRCPDIALIELVEEQFTSVSVGPFLRHSLSCSRIAVRRPYLQSSSRIQRQLAGQTAQHSFCPSAHLRASEKPAFLLCQSSDCSSSLRHLPDPIRLNDRGRACQPRPNLSGRSLDFPKMPASSSPSCGALGEPIWLADPAVDPLAS